MVQRQTPGLCPYQRAVGQWKWRPCAAMLLLLLCIASVFATPCAAITTMGRGATAAGATSGGASAPSLEAMVGQMLLVGFRGTDAAADSAIVRQVRAGMVGGVILFDRDVTTGSRERNIVSPDQLARLSAGLQRVAPVRLFIAVDQEGGRVQRLKPAHGFGEYPSARALGGSGLPIATAQTDRLVLELARAGINLNFAPVVDVDVFAASPAIGKLERSFSADPLKVAAFAQAVGDVHVRHGVVPCLKHFPGHGSARGDSHLGVTDVSATWHEGELVPYQRLLKGWQGAVMVGHLFNTHFDKDHPATLSHATITGVLRNRLGWQGVVISDDLQMKAITSHYGLEETMLRAVLAGNDILLFGNNLEWDPDLTDHAHATLVRLVREGRIPEARIREAWKRIMALKATL